MASRISFASMLSRQSVDDDIEEKRPSVASTSSLNYKLGEEVKDDDIHLFFGPRPAVFTGSGTRVIHGERRIQKNGRKCWLMSEPLSMDKDSRSSMTGSMTDSPSNEEPEKPRSNPMASAGRYLGSKVAQLKPSSSKVNDDSFCDGCGMDPIVGDMYSCSRCENFHLCASCYSSGVHGFEDSQVVRALREDYAVRTVMKACRNKVQDEVFTTLMSQVCRGQIDKFNFLAKWICKVVLKHPVSEFSVRGIEIPRLEPESRATLTSLLTPVLADRQDIAVNMEWFRPEAENERATSAKKREETLRIWFATDTAQKSPFAEGNSVHLSPTSGSTSDMLNSPAPASPTEDGQGMTQTPPPSPTDASFSSSPPFSPQLSDLSKATEEIEEDSAESVKSDIQPKDVDETSSTGVTSKGFEM